MTLTGEQQTIRNFVHAGKGHLIIDALAGTGKTFMLLKALEVIPQKSILVAAFNRRIADEIKTKLPKLQRGAVAHVKTFHALGRAILSKHYPKLEVDQDSTENLINRCGGKNVRYEVRRSAVRLLRLAKEIMVPGSLPADLEDRLLELGWAHDAFNAKMTSRDTERVIDMVIHAGELSVKDIAQLKTIDFCDMVWLPVVLKLAPPSRYQAIIIDELQDISSPQFELVKLVALPTTRFIAAGDRHQQIYQWRGSMGDEAWRGLDAMPMHLSEPLRHLPLTMTWRCSKRVVDEAAKLVPELKARPDADDGAIMHTTLGLMPLTIGQGHSDVIHTFVLSRTNGDLLDAALFLWREGIRFQLNAGQEMLEPLFYLIDYKLDLRDIKKFLDSLVAWEADEIAKADARNATSWIERVKEQGSMLRSALQYTQPVGLRSLLKDILAPGTTGVLLSTVHKVKGLEAERVFLLQQTFARQRIGSGASGVLPDGRHAPLPQIDLRIDLRDDEDAILLLPDGRSMALQNWLDSPIPKALDAEELNIEYVAITRAKTHLIWVDIQDRETQPEILSGAVVGALSDHALGEQDWLVQRALERAYERGRMMDDDDGVLAELTAYAALVQHEISARNRVQDAKIIAEMPES